MLELMLGSLHSPIQKWEQGPVAPKISLLRTRIASFSNRIPLLSRKHDSTIICWILLWITLLDLLLSFCYICCTCCESPCTCCPLILRDYTLIINAYIVFTPSSHNERSSFYPRSRWRTCTTTCHHFHPFVGDLETPGGSHILHCLVSPLCGIIQSPSFEIGHAPMWCHWRPWLDLQDLTILHLPPNTRWEAHCYGLVLPWRCGPCLVPVEVQERP